MTVVTKDKMHIQGKSVEHTVLRVGSQGEGQGVRGGWREGRREWAVGRGEGESRKGEKRRAIKMTLSPPLDFPSLKAAWTKTDGISSIKIMYMHLYTNKVKLENQVPTHWLLLTLKALWAVLRQSLATPHSCRVDCTDLSQPLK